MKENNQSCQDHDQMDDSDCDAKMGSMEENNHMDDLNNDAGMANEQQIALPGLSGNSGNSSSGCCVASVTLDQPSGSELQKYSFESHGENTSHSANFAVRQRNDEHVTESEVKTSSDSNATCAAGVSRGSSRSYASGEQAMTKIVQENTGHDVGRVAVVARASGRNGASSAIASQQGSMAFWKATGPNAHIKSSIGEDGFVKRNLKRVTDICTAPLVFLSWKLPRLNGESSVDRDEEI